MIFDQVVLHNVGVYRGRHVIDLTPPSRSKPVILFGALNGAGKTTLLDSLQIVLYGRHAERGARGDLPYDELLRRSISRAADPHEGACIELAFRHRSEGVERAYRVKRSWSARGAGVAERVLVLRDGEANEALADGWAERVEELIPVRLSKFFFFDGEKIEALADLSRSADALGAAIESLLGLDMVDQLTGDLKVIERRGRERRRSEAERAAVLAVRAELSEVEHRSAEASALREARRAEVDRRREAARALEDKYRRSGGDAVARRAFIEDERLRVRQRADVIDGLLLDLAGREAPLLLVAPLLDALDGALAEERVMRDRSALYPLIEARDARALDAAKAAGATSSVLSALESFLRSDRESIKGQPPRSVQIKMSDEGGDALRRLLARELPEARALSKLLLDERRALQRQLDHIDQTLSATPEVDAVAAVLSEVEGAKQALARAEAALYVAEERERGLVREREEKQCQYDLTVRREADERIHEQESDRIVTHSTLVRSALARFRTAVMERHICRIERLILEGLRHLLRKEGLVSRVSIEPATYRLDLYGDDHHLLPPERLSAGERQLLAVATIWALARSAGRPLPVVIDTPLSRLDSLHRARLVERYFPAASHQVLLLSTDKEIDAAELERLRPSIGRSYKLLFDDKSGSTRVEPGYFW